MDFSKICESVLTTLYLTAQFDPSKQNKWHRWQDNAYCPFYSTLRRELSRWEISLVCMVLKCYNFYVVQPIPGNGRR